MDHFTVTFEPGGRKLSIHAGATLLEAAGQAGIILNTPCGGQGTCGKCKVLLKPHLRAVVACQWRVDRDMDVVVPAASTLYDHQILETGVDGERYVSPSIVNRYTDLMKKGEILGVAVDIGTTTVVAKLVCMADGTVVATESMLNPQTQFGDDVVARIAYAETEQGRGELYNAITECINTLIDGLCVQAAAERSRICEVCVVGNTTMNHIFRGLPLTQLGQAPYRAYSVEAQDIAAGQSPIGMNERGNVHTVANIAGFVGADITAAALAVDIGSTRETTLMVDIGTNGEIVLACEKGLFSASCAAGPAFEGARITCGSRAAEGAIEAVVINEADIDVDVIGGVRGRSLCGSGLIDAVAVMLELGLVDSTGRFVDPEGVEGLSEAIRRRISVVGGEQVLYLVRPDDESPGVWLSQGDIRQFQLAKAAIRAGIGLLQRRLGIADDEIERILLAGAFGSYIRRTSALKVGLLPDVPVNRIKFVGNAACSGARMALLSESARERASRMARKIEYVEIANEAAFTDVYTDAMMFGPVSNG